MVTNLVPALQWILRVFFEGLMSVSNFLLQKTYAVEKLSSRIQSLFT
jgi:hypothetical protein